MHDLRPTRQLRGDAVPRDPSDRVREPAHPDDPCGTPHRRLRRRAGASGSSGSSGSSGGSSSAPGGSTSSGSITPVARSTARVLAHHGSAGRHAAALVLSTAPPGVHGLGVGAAPGPAGAPAFDGTARNGPSALTQIVDALGGSSAPDGLGALLPLILLATLITGVVTVVIRMQARGK